MSFTPPIGDATTSTKGVVRLTGDLGGTASSPTVPGLAGKANASHTHAAGDITTGTFGLAIAIPGTVFRCPWNGSAWTYNGSPLAARPSSRTDIFFELVGAPAATADPSWIISGDTRMDV
jgi:hypothetical protein